MASIKTDRNLENLSGKVCSNLPENGQRFIRHFVQKSKSPPPQIFAFWTKISDFFGLTLLFLHPKF